MVYEKNNSRKLREKYLPADVGYRVAFEVGNLLGNEYVGSEVEILLGNEYVGPIVGSLLGNKVVGFKLVVEVSTPSMQNIAGHFSLLKSCNS
jgi:hypothetical protein